MNKPVKLFRSESKQQEYYNYYDEALKQLTVPYDTFYVKTAYGDTHILHCGQKGNPQLILLHCQGFSSIAWLYNLEELAKYFEIFCVDSIGEPGRTRSNRTKMANEEYVFWLSEVIHLLRLEKPSIAGWSFGGFIAINFAIKHPERIHKLILMSPAASIAPLSLTFYLKLLPALFSTKDEKINCFLKWISDSDNQDFSNPIFTLFTIGMKNFRGWLKGTKLVVFKKSDFQKITAPILLMIGENDPIYKKVTPAELVYKMNNMLVNITAEIIPGTHGFPIQNAALVNQKIVSFISLS
jgi:Predicted hydrolases or acyltransferases (alpha/beta hydrolase superfamily)